jgi:hypothetical protein
VLDRDLANATKALGGDFECTIEQSSHGVPDPQVGVARGAYTTRAETPLALCAATPLANSISPMGRSICGPSALANACVSTYVDATM